ncbi:LOW QUALITY PROTEIN: zinc finger protein DZIP1L [Aythya fuligula]|uniref:LOW QUALITY PROTEIN: zinc finger protein DZIP1L n=1 Tax=Aythya fuligula TaxID=219594 RepID=A0A6J3DF27_AYTFU|nr:LOW QUALITY PROTEIN: zinc finger protein DZIP1L [Aythya fuligula]
MLGTVPGFTGPIHVPCFHFQPRRAGMDWRRFSAVDVERVAREVDVATLQEHIASVTFCNLDGEQCPHCGQPADPVLLKVLRMAQLSIEYLLHCQEHLGNSLATHTQRLQATRAELARAQDLVSEQAAQLRGAKEENRRWKKLMATQQLLLQAGPSSYCKVCVGAGRSHPCSRCLCSPGFAERQKMKRVEQMEQEVEELKEKLRETQQQLAAEREAEKLHREKEKERAHQREEESRRDLERWKEEERMKLRAEMDGLKQLFLGELKDIASRSSAMEGKLQELQAREAVVSSLGTLQDDDSEEMQWQTPSWTEQERAAVQTKLLSANKPEVTRQVTKVLAAEESSEEGGQEDALGGRQRLLEALRRNPNLLKKFRPILEETLEEKLESMGVKRVMTGISTQTYQHLRAVVRLQQQQRAAKFPGLLNLRRELIQAVKRKVKQRKKPGIAAPRQLSIIPGTAVSTREKPVERCLVATTRRPAGGVSSSQP